MTLSRAMLRSALRTFITKRTFHPNITLNNGFLTNSYRCNDAWESRLSSSILQKVNLEDFYNELEQSHSSKGVISAIDVDIFANKINDSSYLEELRDLLYKLRMSAETGNTLESTHYATIRNYLEFGNTHDLVDILKDPLNYGIFLDDCTANVLLDKLLNLEDYEKAATVASLVMLQEYFTNEITNSLCIYSSYKYLKNETSKPQEAVQVETPEENKKLEEIKIRVKFLRNPYFDEHFDLRDPFMLSGKTLAWISELKADNLHLNLQIIGWLLYKKHDKLLSAVKALTESSSPKVYEDTLNFMNYIKARSSEDPINSVIEKCMTSLTNISKSESILEEDLKTLIENAINKVQKNDILKQEKSFKDWEQSREAKLVEQTERLDKARRLQDLEEKQESLATEEQKLWFFENEEKMDLEIENKKIIYPKRWFGKKKKPRVVDEGYIPPEILPKRQ